MSNEFVWKNKKATERVKKAANLLLKEVGVDYFVETIETPDFVQFVGSIGGDIVCFRVYNDGSIYEK